MAQGPAYYDGHDRDYGRGPNRDDDRGPRPDRQAPDHRDNRYDQGPRYGYEPAPPAYPPPQPRRPAAVAIQIHL